MNKTAYLIILFFAFIGCRVHQAPVYPSHTSQNSLDWAGTYKNIMPCADCEGIDTELTIEYDNSYILRTKYLGKDSGNVFTSNGNFEWNSKGNTITLKNEHENSVKQYFVGENYIAQLDMKGARITGDLAEMYILHKQVAKPLESELSNKHWELTHLYDAAIDKSLLSSLPFLLFNANEGRINGNSGCNIINGKYYLENENTIRFSNVASTRMQCGHMQVEADMHKMLKSTLNYKVNADTLTFHSSNTQNHVATFILQNK